MSGPNAPIHLPPVIFLLSDHTTATLAVDVADALSEVNATLYIDDFLSPITNGFAAMFELDFARDMGNPKETVRLMLESSSGDASERDIIVSLEKWFIENFGEGQLGAMGLTRMKINRAIYDYPYLFRDATPTHIQPFLADPSIPRRDILTVNLNPALRMTNIGSVFNMNILTWDTIPDILTVIKAISEHCR